MIGRTYSHSSRLLSPYCPLLKGANAWKIRVVSPTRFGAKTAPVLSLGGFRLHLTSSIYGEPCKFIPGFRVLETRRRRNLAGNCRGSGLEDKSPWSLVSSSPEEVRNSDFEIAGSSSSLPESSAPRSFGNSVTAGRLLLVQLWISSRERIFVEVKLFSQFPRDLARVLLIAMMFVVVGLSSKLLLRRAIAAPAVASSATKEDEMYQTPDPRTTGQESPSGSESPYLARNSMSRVEEETEKYVRDMEREVVEAEAIEHKLADLQILEKECVAGMKIEPRFMRAIMEAVRGKGKFKQAGAIKQGEELLKRLQQERQVVEKEVANNVDNYEAILKEVEDPNLGSKEKASKEESSKEAGDRLVLSWRKLMLMEAAVERMSDLWTEILTVKKGGEEQEHAKELEKVSRDVELQRSTEREASILPLATKVNSEIKPFESVIDEEDRETLQKIEEEQEKAIKLQVLLKKLVDNIYGPLDEEDPEYRSSLAEVKALLPDDLRATFGLGLVKNAPGDDLQTALDWKSWRGRADEDLKRFLLENPEKREEFVQDVQKEILIARDRILSQTWYNEKNKRWEMDSMAALHAIDKKLAGRARVRHDLCVMYLTLKGDDREYYVDTRAFHAEYEDIGGFNIMYMKLITSGVPTNIETMWIPFAEWDPQRLFLLPFKVVYWLLEDVWNSSLVSSVKPWYFKTLTEAFEELMVRFGFPVIQLVLPHSLRVTLGFDLAEGAEAAEPTDIMIWQQEAQKHVDARYGEGSGSPAWWISLPVRTYIVAMPLLFVLKLALKVFLAPFKPQELEMNEAQWKEKLQENMEKELEPQMKKQTIDPIKNVFDKMKRVKRPEVLLKDFAGIDVIKEEISEVISFLKDPKLFRDMGARPPRGVLIVGDSGTGKTTLALAIAAEARVPMIELQGAELEGGAWVGQGASNVRELFKTARELAPLIIFMDDFDHFAGVRGATSDTRKQDHESLINQLLVELDGFETKEGVVLVATTSRPYAIDEALRRPGRMDRTIELPLPNKREREQILRQIALSTMDSHLVDYVDWSKVAEKTAGLTPAQLKHVPEGLEANAVSNKIVDDEELFSIFGWLALVGKVAPKWFMDSRWYKKYNDDLLDWLGLRVNKEDLSNAVEFLDVYGETKPGIELYDPPYVWTREFKFPHAVWAVGKGLVTLLLPNYDTVDLIWLDPRSWEGIAFTKTTKKLEGGYEETGTMSRSYYEKELVSCFGSVVASRMLLPFGQNNSLSKFELDNAKEIATRMVMEYGWAPDDSPMIYQTDGSPIALSMGDQHEEGVSDNINRLFYTACDKAAQMLEQNRPVMEAMVEHLLEWDALGKKDIARIIDEKGAILEQEPFLLVPYTHGEVVGASTNGSGRSAKSVSVPSYT